MFFSPSPVWIDCFLALPPGCHPETYLDVFLCWSLCFLLFYVFLFLASHFHGAHPSTAFYRNMDGSKIFACENVFIGGVTVFQELYLILWLLLFFNCLFLFHQYSIFYFSEVVNNLILSTISFCALHGLKFPPDRSIKGGWEGMGGVEDAPGSPSLGYHDDVNAIHTGGRCREKTVILAPSLSPPPSWKYFLLTLNSSHYASLTVCTTLSYNLP